MDENWQNSHLHVRGRWPVAENYEESSLPMGLLPGLVPTSLPKAFANDFFGFLMC